jgi:DNA-binding transcriptional MerR regulator
MTTSEPAATASATHSATSRPAFAAVRREVLSSFPRDRGWSLDSLYDGLLKPGRSAGGYREYAADAVLTVNQIRRLRGAGLSTDDITFMLPCMTGPDPELEPCPELLDGLRARLRGLDEQIDALIRSRHALADYVEATERRVP